MRGNGSVGFEKLLHQGNAKQRLVKLLIYQLFFLAFQFVVICTLIEYKLLGCNNEYLMNSTQVITQMLGFLSQHRAVPKVANATSLHHESIQRLKASFEEDIAPTLENHIVLKCRNIFLIVVHLYAALDVLELQGARTAAQYVIGNFMFLQE